MATAYISVGSNRGDRMQNLIRSYLLINKQIGSILKVSSVVETEPWGFEDDNKFYNQIFEVDTALEPEKLMQKLLAVEKILGRNREHTGYSGRSMDLDIIFYDSKVLSTPTIEIPHPRMHLRSFVLHPLAEIAPDFIHPVLKNTVKMLLENLSEKKAIPLVLDSSNFIKEIQKTANIAYRYIAIEGNIGAGKTTLATRLAHEWNARLLLEQFDNNPILPKFYENPDRYALPLELSFFVDRFTQLKNIFEHKHNFPTLYIADFFIFKSAIFAKNTLNEYEYDLFNNICSIVDKALPNPDLLVYLHVNIPQLQSNIKKRGRIYEQNIKNEYLQSIQEGYLRYLEQLPNMRILFVDADNLNFVENESDFLKIKDVILKFYEPGIHKIRL